MSGLGLATKEGAKGVLFELRINSIAPRHPRPDLSGEE